MNIKEKLKNEINQCSWELLAPHQKSGALYLIEADLDLLDVAVQIAEDNVDKIQDWLSQKQLSRINDHQASELCAKSFKFVIVRPYVIAQIFFYH